MKRRLPGGERTADVLLWLVIAAPLLIPEEDVPPGELSGLPMPWVRLAAVPLLALAVLVARRSPLAAAALPAGLGLAATPELGTLNFVVAQVVLAYLLGRRKAERHAALLLFGTVFAAGLLLLLVMPNGAFPDALTLAGNVLIYFTLPWFAGQYMQQRAALVRTGWQLAERLEREQQLVSDRVRMRERSRIAGDMHDSLGHELSLIALRAAALQVAPDVGPEGRQAAQELRQAAAAATERLHEVIGVLREDAAGVPVPDGEETVTALVERAAAAGMPVTLVDRLQQALPAMTNRAVYRVAQEALTNATKHAPSAPVTVTLQRDGAEAVVTVANEAPPAAVWSGGSGSPGYGLVGLDERVRQTGGTLDAGPSGDGFTVTARLPLGTGWPNTPPAAAPPRGREDWRRELVLARRSARRKMLHAIWMPAAATAALLLLTFGYFLYTDYRSVLDEDVYARLRIGQGQESVEDRLPAQEMNGNKRPARAPADPPGTDRCLFYRSNLQTLDPVYRLCFAGGRLSHKSELDLDD